MTKQITMSKREYERIRNTLDEIRDVAMLNPRDLKEAKSNLYNIRDLVFKVYELIHVCPEH